MYNKEQGYYQSQLSDDYVNHLLDSERAKEVDKNFNGEFGTAVAPNHLTGELQPLPHVYKFEKSRNSNG